METHAMIRKTVHVLLACAVTFVLCAVAYPALVYSLGQTLFPKRAGGSLIERDGKVVGSALIAQPFESKKYFAPRPSAAGANGYAADAASGSNLGSTNPALRDRIALDAARLVAANQGKGVGGPVPIDLVTTSGSGLDPDISPEAARYQSARVAAARGLTPDSVLQLIQANTDRSGSLIGAPARVNVLRLNLALDGLGASR